MIIPIDDPKKLIRKMVHARAEKRYPKTSAIDAKKSLSRLYSPVKLKGFTGTNAPHAKKLLKKTAQLANFTSCAEVKGM